MDIEEKYNPISRQDLDVELLPAGHQPAGSSPSVPNAHAEQMHAAQTRTRRGGGYGASTMMMSGLPFWRQMLYGGVLLVLFIEFVMVCSALSKSDGLRRDLEDLKTDHSKKLAQIHASLGSKLDCSSHLGTLGSSSEDSDIKEYRGHYYEVVQVNFHSTRDLYSGVNYYDAMIDAHSRCHNNKRGYLVTITSEEEQDFVTSLLPEKATSDKYFFDVWIGGNDAKSEGDWHWANGPEMGVQFWQGLSKADTDAPGHPWGAAYVNWYCFDDPAWSYCNPNNGDGANQDCLTMYGDGKWNDLDCNLRTQAFVVEYGDEPL